MKTSRGRILLVIFGAAVLAAGIGTVLWLIFQPGPAEPMAGGKRLDYWLDRLAVKEDPYNGRLVKLGPAPTNEMSYQEALRQIGPAAVPFILRKLGTNDSPLRNWYRASGPKLPAWLTKRLPDVGPIAFSVRSAESAIRLAVAQDADLVRLMWPATRNHNPAIREVAISFLNVSNRRGLSTNEFMVIYRRALLDSDPMVRIEAIMTLSRLGPAASNAMPELIESLRANEVGRHRENQEHVFVRANAAMALGHMGPVAGGALPALTNLLTTGDGYQRVAAATAIWQITSNVTTALPHLIADLPGLDAGMKPMAARTLGEMGPQAKAAVPVLLTELAQDQAGVQSGPNRNYSADEAVDAIKKALEAIDPEAAARLGTNDEH